MSRLRFTLGQLMAVVFYVGFGIAALRNATAFWASATFSVAIISVSVAIAAAYAGEAKSRVTWAGFASAGGARLLIWLLTGQTIGSLYGPPRSLLHEFQPYINPTASGGAPYIAYTQICNSLDVILLGLMGAVISHLLTADDGRNCRRDDAARIGSRADSTA